MPQGIRAELSWISGSRVRVSAFSSPSRVNQGAILRSTRANASFAAATGTTTRSTGFDRTRPSKAQRPRKAIRNATWPPLECASTNRGRSGSCCATQSMIL